MSISGAKDAFRMGNGQTSRNSGKQHANELKLDTYLIQCIPGENQVNPATLIN